MDVEELLDGLANLRLVRGRMHLERVLAVLDQAVALLGDDRREQHLVRMEAHEDALLSTGSRAASVTSSERAQTTCATSSSDGTVTSTRSTLRNDLISASSPSSATTTSGNCCDQPPRSSSACFVDGSSKPASTNASVPAVTWAESAERRAAFWAFLFTLTEKSRGVGGNATPPPVNWGARIVPARARPVPFWRHGLPRPPATSPRVFADCVPARCAFSSARTASWTRCGFTSEANTPSSRAFSREDWPVTPRSGALGAATLLLPDLDDAVLRARNGALDQQQVLLGIDRVHDEPDLGRTLRAHLAGHLHALHHARGRRGRADGAPLADVVRAVRDGPAAEVVALDRAREPLPDRDAGDLDLVPGLEDPDRDRLADHGLARSAELDEMPVRLRVGLLQVADAGLRGLPLRNLLERELNGLVPVRLLGLELDHGTGSGLDHRHGRHLARLFVEELGHSDLSADQTFHDAAPSVHGPRRVIWTRSVFMARA